jgi:hypothetical protein
VERKIDNFTDNIATTSPGQKGPFTLPSRPAGRHAIRIMPYSVNVESYASYIKPTYLTAQYSFTITQ